MNATLQDLKIKSQWLNKIKNTEQKAAYFLSKPDHPIKIQYLGTLLIIYPHPLWITLREIN
jgi:hypothetical protein